MALSFLYRRNAELCSAMAAASKSAEIRQQWIELAEHWSQKAEIDESTLGATIKREALKTLNIAVSLERAKPSENLRLFRVPDLTPNVVPEEMPPSTTESPARPHTSQQVFSEKRTSGESEDVWTKLIADIRSR
jgi:hypothetical protein